MPLLVLKLLLEEDVKEVSDHSGPFLISPKGS